jgi:hypothetical protein
MGSVILPQTTAEIARDGTVDWPQNVINSGPHSVLHSENNAINGKVTQSSKAEIPVKKARFAEEI